MKITKRHPRSGTSLSFIYLMPVIAFMYCVQKPSIEKAVKQQIHTTNDRVDRFLDKLMNDKVSDAQLTKSYETLDDKDREIFKHFYKKSLKSRRGQRS